MQGESSKGAVRGVLCMSSSSLPMRTVSTLDFGWSRVGEE